jgi:hypothetical protein
MDEAAGGNVMASVDSLGVFRVVNETCWPYATPAGLTAYVRRKKVDSRPRPPIVLVYVLGVCITVTLVGRSTVGNGDKLHTNPLSVTAIPTPPVLRRCPVAVTVLAVQPSNLFVEIHAVLGFSVVIVVVCPKLVPTVVVAYGLM